MRIGRGARARVLTPGDLHLRPRLGEGLVDQCEREDRADRVDGGGLHGHAGQFSVALHSVAGVGEVEVRIRAAAHDPLHVFGVEHEGHLGAALLVLRLRQGVAAVEVVVEVDQASVPELVGRDVVVLDVLGEEAAVQRPLALDTEQRQLTPVFQQVRVGVDARHRRRDPTALHARGRVGQRAHPDHAQRLPGGEQRVLHGGRVLPRADEFEPRLPCHAVPQRPKRAVVQLHLRGVEELRLRQRTAEGRFDQLRGQRTLDLEPEQLRVTAAAPERRGRIGAERDVVAVLLAVVLHPVLGCRHSGEYVRVLPPARQDPVGHDLSAGRDGDVLLGLPDRELGEVVRAVVGQQPVGVRTVDEEVVHVVGEVQERDALVPGALFLTPADVLALHDLRCPRGRVRLPQELDRRTGLVDAVLQAGDGCHGALFSRVSSSSSVSFRLC